MAIDADWSADLMRYPLKRPFLKEQSLWAIWVYRFGRRNDARPEGWLKRLGTLWYWFLFRIVETATGICLPKSAVIGGGLRIWHFGGIFINPGVLIGKNCTLRQGVSIGNRTDGGPVPVIGDDVEFGAYAQVLGGIKLGNRCKVGAMALVIKDVPEDSTAIGVPAHVIPSKQKIVG